MVERDITRGHPERGHDVSPDAAKDAEIDLVLIWRVLSRWRWLIAGVVFVSFTGSVMYALLATKWYRATTVLIPVTDTSVSRLQDQVGSLASLAGINVGNNGNQEAIAVLRSRDFAREFIEDEGLLPVFFADKWDAARHRWKSSDRKEQPDLRDGVTYFEDKIKQVQEDLGTGLVRLSIDWTDPRVAAKWANLLVKRLNDKMRQRALQESEANIKYLQGQLASTKLVPLQQSISRLLENELQKLMLARGNDQFAFRVIDRAHVPKARSRPKLLLSVVVGTVAGCVLSLVLVFILHMRRRAANSDSQEAVEQPHADALP